MLQGAVDFDFASHWLKTGTQSFSQSQSLAVVIVVLGSLRDNNGNGKDNVTNQLFDWLKLRKNNCAVCIL